MFTATRLPPGPPGHLIQGHQAEFRRDPLALLTRTAREYGDLATIRFGPLRILLASHPDYVESVLVTNARIFRKGPALRRNSVLLGSGLLTSEGEQWRRQRRLIQPAFGRERVTAYGEVMSAYAQRAVAGWADGETRDIHAEMMRLTLAIVAKTLFDADVESDSQRVGKALEAALESFNRHSTGIFTIPIWIPTRSNLQLRRARLDLDSVIFRFINARRRDSEDRGDVLSILLGARDESGQPMPMKQLRDEVMTLFLAGHETTAIALSWTFYLLSQNPEVESRLVSELESVLDGKPPTPADLSRLPYLEATVDESLRIYPPAWVVARQSTAPFELGGYQFPEGTIVMTSQWVSHRDPRYFHEPEAFRPERWLEGLARQIPKYAYYPFGGGPRMCIGHSFARMEAALLLATVVQRYHLELAPGQAVVPQPSITLRPRHGIRMVVRRR